MKPATILLIINKTFIMEQHEFRSLAKNRNKYQILKTLDGDLSYAKKGDCFFSDTLFDRGYNILSLVQSGHIELVPRVFPFEKNIIGKNRHSVITVCPECGSHGVNMPLEKECGNCGYTETRAYYDAHTIQDLLNIGQSVQECDATKSDQGTEPLANNSPKEEDVEKMAEDKLKSVYQDTHNALCDCKFEYWVKNIPFGRFLKLAMIEMHNAAKTTK
jgi:ribosomal protein L37E